jgi:hypothetical protein
LVLLLAVLAGLLAGLLRAALTRRRLDIPEMHRMWLVPVAFLPQFFVFGLPALQQLPDALVAGILVSSQFLLMVFACANRRHPGFPVLLLGLALNLAVILLNGGFMPISPEILARVVSDAGPGTWQTGERLGMSKDILLPYSSMKLGWLSDRFLLPDWMAYRVAFSFGDFLIAAGAFWFFAAGREGKQSQSAELWRLIMEMSPIYPTSPSTYGRGLSRLLTAAVINQRFRHLLLTNPETALAAGYNGESFSLANEEKDLVLSIHAKSLADFARQLTRQQNNRSSIQ